MFDSGGSSCIFGFVTHADQGIRRSRYYYILLFYFLSLCDDYVAPRRADARRTMRYFDGDGGTVQELQL